MKKSLLACLAFALILSTTPSVALADDGDDTDTAPAVNPDPGITALHQAVADMKAAKLALATDCPNQSTAKCKTAAQDVRAAFKEARVAAIDAHHAFKDAEKKARDEAKAKAKETLKNKAESAKNRAAKARAPKSPKPAEVKPTPTPTPRG
jgi:hypothetical protein